MASLWVAGGRVQPSFTGTLAIWACSGLSGVAGPSTSPAVSGGPTGAAQEKQGTPGPFLTQAQNSGGVTSGSEFKGEGNSSSPFGGPAGAGPSGEEHGVGVLLGLPPALPWGCLGKRRLWGLVQKGSLRKYRALTFQ